MRKVRLIYKWSDFQNDLIKHTLFHIALKNITFVTSKTFWWFLPGWWFLWLPFDALKMCLKSFNQWRRLNFRRGRASMCYACWVGSVPVWFVLGYVYFLFYVSRTGQSIAYVHGQSIKKPTLIKIHIKEVSVFLTHLDLHIEQFVKREVYAYLLLFGWGFLETKIESWNWKCKQKCCSQCFC